MKRTLRITIGLLVLIALLSSGVSGQTERKLLLVVTTGTDVWADCDMRQRLYSSLVDRPSLSVAPVERADELVHRLHGRYDRQALLTEGRAEKYRYIIWCDVTKQSLTVENGFSLPILVAQKRVRASMALEYHILDCHRNRSVGSDRIVVNENGPATLQCVTLTDADPSLMLSYPEKKALFERLEEHAAQKLMAVFDEIARQR